MIVLAANSELPSPPGWYLHLRADPRAMVQVRDRTLDVRAEEFSADEAAAFWLRLVPSDYARYPKRTSRWIRLLRLVPSRASTASASEAMASPAYSAQQRSRARRRRT
jgi:F420H(2)-dependent quinone reductase